MLVLDQKHYSACLEYLREYHPQSLPIYYLLYGLCKNDLAWDGSEFVVDQWPSPSTILCRPKSLKNSNGVDDTVRQVCYTVTVWSRDPHRLEQLLSLPDILPWDREIMFHGLSCPDDRMVVESVCERFGILDVLSGADCHGSTDCTENMELRPENLIECRLDVPDGYSLGALRPYHAAQVNREWAYGGSDATRLYLEAALDPQKNGYPSAAVLDQTGKAVSYIIYEPEGNMAMGYTDPAHRGKGFFRMVNYVLAKILFDLGRPSTYVQILPSNAASRSTYCRLGATPIVGWRQHWVLYRGPKDVANQSYSVTFNHLREDYSK